MNHAKSARAYKKGLVMMFIAGILIFSVAAPLVAYLVSRSGNLDQGKIATSTTLIAWASMMTGLVLSRVMHH